MTTAPADGPNNDDKETLKRLFVKLKKTEHELQELKRDALERLEPVAVIGMACKLPGVANSPELYWQSLIAGRDAVTEIPAQRWDGQKYYSADRDAPGKSYTKEGAFIDWPVREFDNVFFNISPREARALDPQQRLLLETAWEAIEDASLDAAKVMGSRTGVYVGISSDEYSRAHINGLDLGLLDAYSVTGSTFSTASGRIAYFLGGHGPTMTIDTACSSSLVTIDLAVNALRGGQADMALACGVNLILTPTIHIAFSKLRALSPDGRCKSFDARADGYGRGEGCGVLVLKHYADALRDGDRIHALIRGSAVNQDGRSNGLTAPNGSAQQAVIRQALRNSSLGALDVDYVEAHGTGTPLGDPIELESIGSVYGVGRDKGDALIVGSVKANIGHLEAAAGVASVIKAIMCLKAAEVPRQIHFHEPNPLIPWDELPVMIPRETYKWERRGHPRRVGVNAFGFSGTNAHVILEEAPQQTQEPSSGQLKERASEVLCLSARGEEALREMARQYARELDDKGWRDMVHSANAGRSGFDRRMAVVGEGAQELSAALVSYADGAPSARVIHAAAGEQPAVVFQYTGQGSQHVGMGLELYESSVAYREAYDEAEAELSAALGESLRKKMYESTEQELERTQYAQPAIFAMQYALTALWRSLGIAPSAVMGHSVGEYAAAVAAGVMNLTDGARLMVERGRLLGGLPEGVGVMAAVFAGEEEVRQALAGHEAEVSIATVNAPGVTVVSGASASVDKVLEVLKARGRKSKRLRVSHGFHSPLVEPVLGRFREAAQRMEYRAPEIPFYSCLEPGRRVDMGAEYWTRHVREAVRYMDGARAAWADGYRVYLEVGPAATLSGLLKQGVDGAVALSSSAGRAGSEWASVLEAVGRLYTMGAGVKLRALDAGHARNRVTLPHYPFQRKTFWMDPRTDPEAVTTESASYLKTVHPLLGSRVDSPKPGATYFKSIDSRSAAYLYDHRIHGIPVIPATAYLELGIAAATDLFGADKCCLERVVFYEPLVLSEEGGSTLQCIAEPDGDGLYKFEVYGRGRRGSWKLHAGMRLVRGSGGANIDAIPEDASSLPMEMDASRLYGSLNDVGYTYGERFRGVKDVRYADYQTFGHVLPPASLGPDMAGYTLQPAVLDICFHTCIPCFHDGSEGGSIANAFIPVSIDRVTAYGALSGELAIYQERKQDAPPKTIMGDIGVFKTDGGLLAAIDGITLREVKPEVLQRVSSLSQGSLADLFYKVDLVDATPSHAKAIAGPLVVMSEPGSRLAGTIATALRDRGIQFQSASFGDGINSTGGFILALDPPEGAPAADVFKAEVRRTTSWVLHMLQDALAKGLDVRICLMTSDAALGGSNVAHSALWGVVAGAVAENPGMDILCIDLQADAGANDIGAAVDMVIGGSDEAMLARRGGKWLVPRLGSVQVKEDAPAPVLDAGASYLITGGLGALGLMTARQLTRWGARHIVLAGRNPDKASGSAQVAALRELGVTVEAVAADMSDYQSVSAMIARFGMDFPILKGVVHAAGVLQDATLSGQSPESYESVYAPKAYGAWNLHLALQGIEGLEFLVFYSSATTVFGSPGQSNYIASNTVLDHLARYRRNQGLPGLAVNWGPWAGGGMATEEAQRGERLKGQGIRSLEPERCFEALGAALSMPIAQVAVIDLDWERFGARVPESQRARFYKAFSSRMSRRGVSSGAARARPAVLDEMAEASPERRAEMLVQFVREAALGVLGYDDGGQIDTSLPLSDQGFDSLLAVELRNRLAEALGVALPASLLFDFPSISKIASHLSGMLFGEADKAKDESARDILKEIDDLIGGDE